MWVDSVQMSVVKQTGFKSIGANIANAKKTIQEKKLPPKPQHMEYIIGLVDFLDGFNIKDKPD